MTDAVDGVEGEWERECELEGRQRRRAEVETVDGADDGVRTFGTDDGGKPKDRCVSGQSDAGAAVGDGKHAGELRFVDRQMRRLRAVQAQVLRVEAFVDFGCLRNDFDGDITHGVHLRFEQSRIADQCAAAEGPKSKKQIICLRSRLCYIIFSILMFIDGVLLVFHAPFLYYLEKLKAIMLKD